MRILHVTRETADDRRFGIGRSLRPVVDALAARGHEVHYLTQEDLGPRARDMQPRLAAALTPTARALYGEAGRILALVWAERVNMGRLAAKLAPRLGADVVHLHDPWMAWAFRLASLVNAGASAVPWGLSEHGFGCYAEATREEGLRSTPALLRRLRRLEAAVLRRAHWVTCPTAAARHQLARDLVLAEPPPHWHVVAHARPALTLPSREGARSQLGLAPGMPHVLAVGRINPVKRMDHVVAACASLQRPLRLTLLAAGDAVPLEALAAQSPQLQLCVRCVDDVAPYLAAADVYLSASRNESFGMANLEALCAGLPSICTAVGGVPEVTAGAAWLLPGGDDGLVHSLAEGLRALLDNPAVARYWSERARLQAAAWPDADDIAQRYETIYRLAGR